MSFWDKVKDFVGIESNYYDDEEYYDDYYDYDNDDPVEKKEEVIKEEPEVQKNVEVNRRVDKYPKTNNYQESKKGLNSKMILSIREPLTFDDAKLVIDDLKSGKSVVLNLEMLEVEQKTQIFYFVSGGVYALNGAIQNVTKDIYVLAPQGTDIDGAMKDQILNKNLYQV